MTHASVAETDSSDSQDPSLHFGKKDAPLCLQSLSEDDIRDVPLAPTKRVKKKSKEKNSEQRDKNR